MQRCVKLKGGALLAVAAAAAGGAWAWHGAEVSCNHARLPIAQRRTSSDRGYAVAKTPRPRNPTAAAPRPPIEPRDMSFDLDDEHAGRWHSDNPYISHFWNGLSLMFPDGERHFIRSVARVRELVSDPELQRE